MISNQSLTCPKGASLTFEIDMDTGSDLTGATAQWALCESWFDNAKVYLTKTGVGDGLFIGQDGGVWKITVNLAPTDTLDIPSGLLYHDCKVLLQSGDVEDVANGPFSLDPSVNILLTNVPVTRNLRSVPQSLSSIGQTTAGTVGALGRNLQAAQTLAAVGQSAAASGRQIGFVCDGDSLTFSIAKMPYPKQLSNLTGLGAINLGVAGQQLSGMDTDYATHTAPSYNSATANTLILTGGINDIISGGGTQSSINTSIRSYVAKAKATGFKVYITTITPVTVGTNGFTSGMETIRQAVNTDRVANWAQYADGLIDLAASASLSDPTNTVQYLDNIHWTNASNYVVADLVRAGVGLSAYTPAARATATTFDPSNKEASVTLSNGNLTAVGGGSANTVQVRSVASIRPRDKVYFEIVLDNAGNANSGFGFGVTEYNAGTTDNFLGAHTFDVCLLIGLGGVVYHNSAGTGEALSTAVTTSGSRYGVAVDRINNKWWARLNGGSWNNDSSANPTTNVGGFDLAWTYADDLFAALMIPSESMTVNFGATPFTDTKPTDYNIT